MGFKCKKIEVDKSINKAIPIVFVKPSYHGNPNLGAQKGLFTLWEFITYEQQNNSPEVTPLDIYLKIMQKTMRHCYTN